MKRFKILFALIALSSVVLLSDTLFAQGRDGRNTDEKRPFQRQWNMRHNMFDFSFKPEDEQRALEFMKEISEERYDEIIRMKYSNDNRYNITIHWLLRKIAQMDEVKDSEPDTYKAMVKELKLFTESILLSTKYKKSNDEKEKADLEKKLKNVISEWFDVRHILKQREIAQLENKIEELKKELVYRANHKNDIIEEQLKRYLQSRRRGEW